MMIEDEELRNLYKAASAEHIEKIEAGILHLERHPQDTAKLEELLREAHSIKGDSRILGVQDAETLTHQIEEILTAVKQGRQRLDSKVCDLLYQGIDAVKKIANEAVTGQPSGVSVFHVVAQLMGAGETPSAPTESAPSFDSSLFDESIPEFSSPSPPPEPEPDQIAPDFTARVEDLRLDTLRVEAARLDRLLSQAGELLVTKGRFSDRIRDLQAVQSLWEEWNREAFISRLVFDELERRLQIPELKPIQSFYHVVDQRLERLGNLVGQLKDTAYDDTARLEIVSNDLESGIRALRLVPMTTLFNQFPRAVRDLAQQLGKEVNLVLEGKDIRADKQIIEEMKAPLTHLVRNAIDHGIETPEERQSQGKSWSATLRLRASQTASTVVIEVIDDGRGLDIEAIKRSAVRKGMHTEAEVATMSPAQIQSLIFAPGFSTRSTVTEISGRGVGLDVVRSNVERLKGSIQIESTAGKGCLFRLTLNTSLATTYAVIVEVNQTSYALPAEFVNTMLLVSPQEIFAIEGSQTITFEGEPVSVVWLADLLGLSVKAPATTEGLTSGLKTLPCIMMQMGNERLGLLVDRLLEQQDIVLKPQSKLLKRIRNITGATILGNGQVCMVLSPLDLFKSAKKGTLSVTVQELAEQAQVKRKILLCDDSIPIRTQLKRILEGAGYDVIAAVDGQDGFSKLRTGTFDAVVSDVQMPNLDGLGLAAKIRQYREYAELPVILVTTLASDEDKRRGAEAGANAYITKSDFDQRVLLDTLRRLI